MKKYSIGLRVFLCVLPFALLPTLYLAARFILSSFSLPPCFTYELFHILCPGCGLTRAVYALTKGDVLLSLRQNPLLLIGIAVCAAYYVELLFWAFGKKLRLPLLHNLKALWAALAIVAVFSLLRNFIPALAPLPYIHI